MSSDESTNGKRIKELEEEVRKLLLQNDTLQKRIQDSQIAQIRQLKTIAKLSLRMTLGPSLNNALQAWLSSYETYRSFPKQESIDVLTAVFQRIIRVGLFSALITILPTLLLIWQNMLLQAQLYDQRFANYITRKSELTSILYETTCETSEPRGDYHQVPVSSCPPKANKRRRSEAARALLITEWLLGGSSPDLTGALLSETWLPGIDLRKVKLYLTDFRSANLGGADFREALLDNADFTGANLFGANFQKAGINDVSFVHANMPGTDFRSAKLLSIDFRNADLRGAWFNSVDFGSSDLRDANLESSHLAGANLTFTFYNDRTTWPSQFDVTRSGAIKCAIILGPHLPSNKPIAEEPCQPVEVQR
jgi:hypothetical protein